MYIICHAGNSQRGYDGDDECLFARVENRHAKANYTRLRAGFSAFLWTVKRLFLKEWVSLDFSKAPSLPRVRRAEILHLLGCWRLPVDLSRQRSY